MEAAATGIHRPAPTHQSDCSQTFIASHHKLLFIHCDHNALSLFIHQRERLIQLKAYVRTHAQKWWCDKRAPPTLFLQVNTDQRHFVMSGDMELNLGPMNGKSMIECSLVQAHSPSFSMWHAKKRETLTSWQVI